MDRDSWPVDFILTKQRHIFFDFHANLKVLNLLFLSIDLRTEHVFHISFEFLKVHFGLMKQFIEKNLNTFCKIVGFQLAQLTRSEWIKGHFQTVDDIVRRILGLVHILHQIHHLIAYEHFALLRVFGQVEL